MTYSSLEHVVRTGHPNRHYSVCTDCFHPRTGEEISWWLELFSEEQDQLLQTSSEWSQRTRSSTKVIWSQNSQDQVQEWSEEFKIKDEDQREMFCLEENHKSQRFIFILFRTLCTISAKYANINHLHKEKVFSWKSLIHCLKIRDWDQCTSCSYTSIPNLLSY